MRQDPKVSRKDWKRSMKWLRWHNGTCMHMHIIAGFRIGLDWDLLYIPSISLSHLYTTTTPRPPSIDQSNQIKSLTTLSFLALALFFWVGVFFGSTLPRHLWREGFELAP